MLKLTNSFYRYFTVTCENFNIRTHVRVASQSHRRERCIDSETRGFHTSPQLNKHGNTRKRFRVKIPPLNDQEFERSEQMSDSLQPTNNHVSHGGTFSVSDEENSSEEGHRSKPLSSGERKCQIPNIRTWETIDKWSKNSQGTFKFKVVSYNVLAQYLLECHPYLYTECEPRDLKWEVRAARLYEEIITLAPDILCLQEVQVSHLKSFYSKFEDIGYLGIFKQKTGDRQDGCAIYFKQSIFELQDQVTVEFYQPELPILNRDNIGVMVKLAPRTAPDNPIVVATTHLLYNPKRTDVRLAQIQVFLAEIDRFAYFSNDQESGHFPIILTGDLNSTPDDAVIKLLDKGHVSATVFRDNSDWQRIGVTDNCQHLSVYLNRREGKKTDFNNVKIHNSDYRSQPPDELTPNEEFSVFFNTGELCHSLRLLSVYNKYKKNGEYEASTFQDYWVTVDYIYFSYCSSLCLKERLRLPTVMECDSIGRLPNEMYASDHLALAAIFELYPANVKRSSNVGKL